MYEFFKIVHICAVITWMAGIFYLPRLFVYHSEADDISEKSETFKVMEYKLYKYIMTPSMYFVVFTGLYIAYIMNFYMDLWFHIKFFMVILMLIYHFYLGKLLLVFKNNLNSRPSKFYRILNEVPTILMIIIVALVIAKPVL